MEDVREITGVERPLIYARSAPSNKQLLHFITFVGCPLIFSCGLFFAASGSEAVEERKALLQCSQLAGLASLVGLAKCLVDRPF